MFARALITDVQWVLLAALAVLVLTAIFSVSRFAGLAIAQDALPILLALAWVTLVVALVKGAWILAVGAGLVCLYHLYLILPRVVADRVPKWAYDAPTIQLVVSNVFIDNETPGLIAQELLDTNADVLIISEWNPKFAAEFDSRGGRSRYPHRVCEAMDGPDYAVCVLSRLELQPGSEIVDLGPLKLVDAVVMCGDRRLHIMGLNPMAAVDPGGFDRWKEQFDTLAAAIDSFERPFVIAGDLNTTQFRPQYRRLLRHGVSDAHDALGKGLTTSFKLAATGLLAAPGSVVRLDHALLSPDVKAVEIEDLDECGSDHQPFRLVLAIRPADSQTWHPAQGARQPRHSTRGPSADREAPNDQPEQLPTAPRTRDR